MEEKARKLGEMMEKDGRLLMNVPPIIVVIKSGMEPEVSMEKLVN